jgi:hypothetical protein
MHRLSNVRAVFRDNLSLQARLGRTDSPKD